MKILIAVTSHVSYRLVEGQIRYLTGKGHSVYFVSSYNTSVSTSVRSEGGNYRPIEMEREMHPFRDLIALLKIISLLYRIKPDVVNASTPKAGLLFMIAAKLAFTLKLKTIFTLRGLRSETLKGFKYRLIKNMETLSCSLADKVIVISPSLRDHAIKEGILSDKKGVVIGLGSSNGININRFTNKMTLSEVSKMRVAHNIPAQSLVYGYVGRIVVDKGIVELYNAFCKFKNRQDNAFLLLIGSYDEVDGIPDEVIKEIRANKNILLLDYVRNIEDFFPLMDVFILFSHREGFGNVVVEAASMGIPAIVSDIPGLRDTIENHHTGLLAQPRNSDDLKAQMETFFLNRQLIKEYGENARVRVEKFFNNESIWEGQEAQYNELTNV